MDPDQTAPTLFVGKASKTFQQTTKADPNSLFSDQNVGLKHSDNVLERIF